MIFDEIWRDLLKFDEIQWDSTRCDEIWRDLTRLYKIIYLWDGPSWLTQHYRTLRTCRTGRPALPTSELAQLHVEPKKNEKMFVNSMISSSVFIYYIKKEAQGEQKKILHTWKNANKGGKNFNAHNVMSKSVVLCVSPGSHLSENVQNDCPFTFNIRLKKKQWLNTLFLKMGPNLK